MADSPAAAWRDLVGKATKGPWIVHSEYHSGPKWMHLPASLIYTVGFAIDAQHRGVGPGIDDYRANAHLIVATRSVAQALAEWVAAEDALKAELQERLRVLTTTDMAVIVSPGQNEIEQMEKLGAAGSRFDSCVCQSDSASGRQL